MRVAVLGGGALGLAAASELARRGHDVTVVEAASPGHDRSASAAWHLWSLAHPDPRDVRLAVAALHAWRTLGDQAGGALPPSGGLLHRTHDAPGLSAVLTAEDVDHVLVDPADVGRFVPALSPSGVPALWLPEGGPLRGALLAPAETARLEAAGGAVRCGLRALAVEPGPGGVRLVVAPVDGDDLTDLHADVAVLAPGPWAGRWLAALDVPADLRPSSGQLTVFAPDAPRPCLLDAVPGAGRPVLGLPVDGGYAVGLPAALPWDVDAGVARVDAAELDLVTWWAQEYGLGGPSRTVVAPWVDGAEPALLLDTVADGRVVLAVGDTAHGALLAPLVGSWVADLADGLPGDPDVDRFRITATAPEET
jgi:sarcosine oxidase